MLIIYYYKFKRNEREIKRIYQNYAETSASQRRIQNHEHYCFFAEIHEESQCSRAHPLKTVGFNVELGWFGAFFF